MGTNLRLRATSLAVRMSAAGGLIGVGQIWRAASAAAFPGEGIVKDAAGSVWDGITGALAGWLLDGVGFFAHAVLGFLGDASTPRVTAVWFAGPGSPFRSVTAIAGVLLVGFALLAVLQALLRGDVGMMLSRVLGAVPAAVFATITVTVVTAKLLALTDALAASVLDPTGPAAERFLSGFTLTASLTGNGFAVVIVALVAALAGLALWAELLVRAALIYTLVALSPLTFAAMVWPAARGAARRLVELLVAVIVAKLVISIVLAIGIAAVGGIGFDTGGGGTAHAVGQLLVGAVLLGVAAFSPFLVLRLFPHAEAAAVAHGTSRAPLRTAISALYVTNSATRFATGASGTSGVIGAAETATRAATQAYDLGRATPASPSSDGAKEPQ